MKEKYGLFFFTVKSRKKQHPRFENAFSALPTENSVIYCFTGVKPNHLEFYLSEL